MKAMPTGCHQGRGYWQNDDSDCTPPSARTEGCCFQAPRSVWPFSQQPTTDQASVQPTEKFTFTLFHLGLSHWHTCPTNFLSGSQDFLPLTDEVWRTLFQIYSPNLKAFKSFYKCTWGEHNPKQKSLWLQNTTKKTMSKFWLLSQVNLKLLLLNIRGQLPG